MQILFLNNVGDMGICTLVPVQEALNIHNIASLQLTSDLIQVGFGSGQIAFNAEAVGLTIQSEVYIDVLAGSTATASRWLLTRVCALCRICSTAS